MGIDVEALGKRLTQLRELRGESLHSLAGRAGVAKSYLAKLERGEVGNPGLQTLNSIGQALDVTLADLLSRTGGIARSASAKAALDDYERIIADLPPGLQEFLDAWERHQGERLPADVIRSLAQIEFRGRRPRTAEDWRFVYNALKKTME